MCAKHHVTVVPDEVHGDIVRPGVTHMPFAAVNELNRSICVTCSSPSKAFNVAGLQSAYFICDDDGLRARAVRGVNTDEVAGPNDFAVFSTIAAYADGGAWLDDLCRVLQRNKDYVSTQLDEHAHDMLHMVASDSTYLAWIDCSGLLIVWVTPMLSASAVFCAHIPVLCSRMAASMAKTDPRFRTHDLAPAPIWSSAARRACSPAPRRIWETKSNQVRTAAAHSGSRTTACTKRCRSSQRVEARSTVNGRWAGSKAPALRAHRWPR